MLLQGQPDAKIHRSKGCRVCVKRRIKCDLTRPTCDRCGKSGRTCPGYASSSIFLDLGPQLRKRYKVTTTTQLEVRPRRRLHDTTTPPLDQHLSGHGRKNGNGHYDLPSATREVRISLSASSRFSYHDQLLSQLIATLPASSQQRTATSGHPWVHMLEDLASNTETTPALDTSIQALSLLSLGRQFGDHTLVLYSRQIYGQALFRINAAIQNAWQGLSNQTLAATVLLSIFEILNLTGNASWIRHARGATRLLQARGPDAHREGLGKSILHAYRSFAITEALTARQPCFLNSPNWRKLLYEHFSESPRDSYMDALEAWNCCNAEIPGFFQEITDMHVNANASLMRDFIRKGRALRARLHQAHRSMTQALEANAIAPVLISSNRDDHVFPIVYRYPTTYVGSRYCTHWTVRIFLNQSLKKLEDRARLHAVSRVTTGVAQLSTDQDSTGYCEFNDQKYDHECIDLARKICMSAEDLCQSIFVSSTLLVFALRTALVFVETNSERDWICTQMSQLNQYPSIAKKVAVNMLHKPEEELSVSRA